MIFQRRQKVLICSKGLNHVKCTKYGLPNDKFALLGFQQSDTQTSLLSFRDELENEISPVSSLYTILSKKRITRALVSLRRLVCAF